MRNMIFRKRRKSLGRTVMKTTIYGATLRYRVKTKYMLRLPFRNSFTVEFWWGYENLSYSLLLSGN